MNVSMQLIQTARSAHAGLSKTLHEVDLDMALTLSAALAGQQDGELEAIIVVQGPAAAPRTLQAAHTGTFPSLGGWLRGVRHTPVTPPVPLH